MGALFKNNGFSTLASGITDVALTMTVAAGEGARFPSPTGADYFYCTLIDTSNNLEIVKCTTRATDVFTIVRAQEGTTGRAYSTADRVELRITAAGLTEFVAADTTDTLTNKSIDLGTNTLTGSLAEFNTALQSESFATLGGAETLVTKTLTSPVINTGVSGTAIDTDVALTANSDTLIASQKATKAYADAAAGGGLIGIQVITATGTYTATTGTSSVVVHVVGGGGSGGAGNDSGCCSDRGGGGGGAGGYVMERITAAFDGVTATVGAGGAAQTTGNTNGNNGGTSSFGTLNSAPGGTGGLLAGTGGGLGSAGGTGTGGDINLTGETGRKGNVSGGGKGGNAVGPWAGSGGYGGNIDGATTGGAGGSYGAGGGGGYGSGTKEDSGAGGAGIIVVFEYS